MDEDGSDGGVPSPASTTSQEEAHFRFAAAAAYNATAAPLLSTSPPKPAVVSLPHIPGVSYRLRTLERGSLPSLG